jgi:lysophospholipase L1-like esterase
MGLGRGPSPNPTPGYLNYDAALLPKWRAALCKLRTGGPNVKLAAIGDSQTAGAAPAPTLTSERVNAWPNRLGNMLAVKYGITSGIASVFGPQFAGSGSLMPLRDSRVVITGGWTSNGTNTPGGGQFVTGVAGTIAFTPATAIDHIDVYWTNSAAAGSIVNINVDGGATLAALTSNGLFGYSKTSISTTLGVHTINVVWQSGTSWNFHAIHAYASATPELSIWNWGQYGWTSAAFDANTNSYDTGRCVPNVLQPDLTFIMLGVNDARAAMDPAVFAGHIQNLIGYCKTTGDVVLVGSLPADVGQAPILLQTQMRDASARLAVQNAVPFIDTTHRLVSNVQTQALGLTDALHGFQAVNVDLASAAFNLLAA